jgi:iron(III) transport system ATP-binding protein
VHENIAYGLHVKKLSTSEIRRRVDAIAAVVDLEGRLARQPNQLSGGQQQRVALARALVMEPKVLLFDEPLSNLDAKLRLQMREQIRSLQQRFAITAVYVTHDQAEAMALSDRVVVMNSGRVEQVGPPTEIYAHPATRFVADFIGRANFLEGSIESVASDTVRVRTLGSVLDAVTGPGHSPPSVGQRVTLVLRPEALNVEAREGPLPEGRGLAGEVTRAVYLGAVAEYDIAVVGGETLSVAQYGPAARWLHALGTPVVVRVLPGAAHILPRTPPA